MGYKHVLQFVFMLLLSATLLSQKSVALTDSAFEDKNPLPIKKQESPSNFSSKNTIVIVGTYLKNQKNQDLCTLIRNSIWNVLSTNVHCIITTPSLSYQKAISEKKLEQQIIAQTRFIIQLNQQNPNSEKGIFTIVDTQVPTPNQYQSPLIKTQSVRINSLNQVDREFFNRESSRLLTFYFNQNKIQKFWVKRAAILSQNLTFDQKTNLLLLCDKKTILTNSQNQFILNEFGERQIECVDPTPIEPETAAKRIASEQEGPESAHYLRTAIELATVAGISAYVYYNTEDMQDHDYNSVSFSRQLKNKFVSFEAWKFDDNTYQTNFLHVFPAGWAYYGFARANGISAPWSLLISFCLSTFVWESGVEFREISSINDVIFTPLGGFVIAEGLYQLAQSTKKHSGIINQVIASVLDPFTTIHEVIDNPNKLWTRITQGTPNSNGIIMRPDEFSTMTVSLSVEAFQRKDTTDADTHFSSQIGIVGEKINIPEYLAAGTDQDYFLNVLGSYVDFKTSVYGSPNRTQLYIRNLLSGYYQKSISRDRDGNLKGYSLILAPSMGFSVNSFDFDKKDTQNGEPTDDFSAILHVLGATGQLVLIQGESKMTFDLTFSGDIAMIRSYGFEKYKNSGGDMNRVTGFIERRNYTHSIGGTIQFTMRRDEGPWSTGIGIIYTRLWDINPDLTTPATAGKEVTQSEENISDSMTALRIFLSRNVTENFSVMLEGQLRNRWGKVGIHQISTDDYYAGLNLNYKLY